MDVFRIRGSIVYTLLDGVYRLEIYVRRKELSVCRLCLQLSAHRLQDLQKEQSLPPLCILSAAELKIR